MKNIVLLLSIFFLSLNVSSQAPTYGGRSQADIDLEKAKQKDADSIRVQKRACDKNSGSSPITLSNGSEVTCDNISDYFDSYGISFKAAEACVEAYDEYVKEAKEDKETASDKLEDLKKEKIDALDDAQKELSTNQEAIATADENLAIATTEYKNALNALEEETQGVVREKSKELSGKISALQKLITVDTPQIAAGRDARYTQCKATAETEYQKQLAAIKQLNKAQNKGVVSSGGANFRNNSKKEIQKRTKEWHSDCIRSANSAYDAEMKTVSIAEAELKQDIQSMQKELEQLAGDKYQKKIVSLQETFNIAQQKATAEKQRLAQEAQRIQTTAQQRVANIDAKIKELMDKASGKITITADDKPSYFSKCCRNGGLAPGVAGYNGAPDPAQCKVTRAKRGRSGTTR